ncbi:hypothetical protein TSUD_71010 [Trifolium subterraneum]|uniref:NAD(P)H oxidase (H(2)O(2)-forming) n=1 Tax=Trifolium subterraneum TaxID=3900 RepID=A0A2Z6N8G7_TRISU|nr:hypothetical protein TSUD_71010 [Trifolium subterraneum]
MKGSSPDLHHHESDIELTAPENSTKLSTAESKASTDVSYNKEEDADYVEVTMDIQGDSVALHSVKTITESDMGEGDHEKLSLTGKRLDRKKSFGASVVQNATNRIKQLRRMATFSKPEAKRLERTKSAVGHALTGLKFISLTDVGAGWCKVEKEFEKLTATTDGYLPRALFAKCIGLNEESKAYAEKLFDTLARQRGIQGGSINKIQFREFWDCISDQSFDTRLKIFFDMVDKDADGRINEEEIKDIICLSATANKLSNIQIQAEEYAALIMEELDPDDTGYILIGNLETLLLHGPEEPTRGESKYLSQMLSQKLRPTFEENPIKRWYRDTKYFFQDNWRRSWVFALWIGVMLGLFAYKFVQYRRRAAYEVMGHCVCMAKGAAETLKLNMAIILLPVCRNTITWLRNRTKLGAFVPFDDGLNFHKMIAVAISIGVGIHAIYHLACDFPRLLHASSEKYKLMKPFFGDQPSSYWHFVKSWEGVTGILMVVLMTIAFTLANPRFRRNRTKLPKPFSKLTGFNAFWYSHHLFVVVYALLIIHGTKLYLSKEWYKKTVAVYPGNVLAINMSKPQGFSYKSGQYMLVNCAAVSPLEWHPFSITSAPNDDYLSVHIKILGDWTRGLKTKFSQACQPAVNGQSGLLRAECLKGDNSPSTFPKVLIDGPYGAPAQDYREYEVVLLVGLGIGATPMISILKDMVNNFKAMEEEDGFAIEEGSPVTTNHKDTRFSDFKTRRAYFYWVTREQGSFDWFKGVMNEVAEEDRRGLIELHSYCTSVYEQGDARSALIAMVQSINHAKNGVDIVSGTRVKSHFAKPNWRTVYKRIALNHPAARVGVFYCGPSTLTHELRQLSLDFSHNTSTKYDFHKENF